MSSSTLTSKPILSMLLIPLAAALCLAVAGTDGDEADIQCREDFGCWSTKHLSNAVKLCAPMIEDRAPFGYRWRDTGRFTIFSMWQPDEETGGFWYWGDKVLFNTGLGQWQPMTYTCRYNSGPYPDSGYVERLTVQPR